MWFLRWLHSQEGADVETKNNMNENLIETLEKALARIRAISNSSYAPQSKADGDAEEILEKLLHALKR